jgi:hypothetical protein
MGDDERHLLSEFGRLKALTVAPPRDVEWIPDEITNGHSMSNLIAAKTSNRREHSELIPQEAAILRVPF